MPLLITHRRATIRTKAVEVLAQVPPNLAGFELLRHIAEREGIDLFDATLGDLAGTLRRDGERWEIHLNRQDGETRRRCTLARLLGHFFLHAGRAGSFVAGGFMTGLDSPTAAEEWEAREFAAEVLMPRTAVADRLPGGQPTGAQTLSLAAECGVSPLTMAVRLRQLGYTVPAAG